MRFTGFVLAALFSFNAHALDHSDSVTVTPLLKTTTSWDGKPISYPSGQAEVTGLIVEIAPGAETGWHLHPVSSFAVLIDGALDVSLEDGKIKHLEKGDSLAEVVNVWHNGRSVGIVPARIVVFYTGAVGQALTIKKP